MKAGYNINGLFGNEKSCKKDFKNLKRNKG